MVKNRIALVHFSPLHSWSHQKAAKLNWWGTWCNFLQHLLMRSVWCSPMWRLPAKKRSRSLLTSVMNFSTPVTSVMILGATVQWTSAVCLSLHGNGQGCTCLFPVTFVSGCGKCVNMSDPTDGTFLRLNKINMRCHPRWPFLGRTRPRPPMTENKTMSLQDNYITYKS